MTVREALQEGVAALTYSKIPSAELDAEVLLCAALRTNKEDLCVRPERIVPKTFLQKYQELILRRADREPVAYLVGEKEFYGRPFHVTRSVLIPRPESEGVVEQALALLPDNAAATIVDIGTGSGCLGVTLALERLHCRVVASDVSVDALRIAERNAARHRVTSRMEFVNGDLLLPHSRRQVDLILANLPYVPADEVRSNPDLTYEPLLALRGQHGPELTLQRFLDQWYEREVRPTVIMEIHPNQADVMRKENEKIGVTVDIKPDLAGRPRVAILQYEGLMRPAYYGNG